MSSLPGCCGRKPRVPLETKNYQVVDFQFTHTHTCTHTPVVLLLAAIMVNLHRIPTLARRYIVMMDDMFFGNHGAGEACGQSGGCVPFCSVLEVVSYANPSRCLPPFHRAVTPSDFFDAKGAPYIFVQVGRCGVEFGVQTVCLLIYYRMCESRFCEPGGLERGRHVAA